MYINFSFFNTNIGDNMFDRHEIRVENGQYVLYLYATNDYEFSFDFLKPNNINKFLKKMDFKGSIVKIVVSGMVISTIFLNTIPSNNYKSVDTSLNNTFISELKAIPNIENEDEVEVENKNTQEENKDVTTTSTVDSKIEKNTTSTNTTKSNNNSTSSNTSSKTTTSSTTNKTTSTNTSTKTESNNTYVTLVRSSGTQTIELEEYLIGVVGAEMPASFNLEALKTQAVVARTYTLKKVSNNQKITDSVSDQVYKNNDELKAMWGSSYNTYYNKIKSAVTSTKGEYITYKGTYIDAVYHSTSNGTTEDAVEVWGKSFDYLKPVDSSWDKSVSSYEREVTKTYSEVSSKLGFAVNKDTEISILSRTSGNRVKTIKIGDTYYTGVEIRNLLGLRSSDFLITKTDSGLTIKTYGYGHGVGMSQYGAQGMAQAGYNYKQIITHYYNGVSIVKS